MKKINNKYRNNNFGNSQIYSLNYKFDSTSPAGKINGTALDLIKRYNELAKDAMSNNDYITAEPYRQYAEHYPKIVTEINETTQQQRPQPNKDILVEGNAIDFVKSLDFVEIKSIHKDFGTVKTEISGVNIDFASTRIEEYPKSGCL